MKNTTSRELNAQDSMKATGSQTQNKSSWRSSLPSSNKQASIPIQTSEVGFSQYQNNRQGYESAENSFPGVGMEQAFDGSKGGAFNFLGEARDHSRPSAYPVSSYFNPGIEKSPISNSLEAAEDRFAKKVRERFGKKTDSMPVAESLISKMGWTFGGESMRPPTNPYAETSSDYGSVSTVHSLGASRIADSMNLEYNPRSFLSEASFMKPPVLKPVVEEKKPNSVVIEEQMTAINDHQINCVSLLNEVGSKVKKKVDYTIKEVPNSKIKV